MHWTTHIITGANLGGALDNPALAGLLGYASHALLDAIPHHDPDREIGYVIDSMLGGLILLYLRKKDKYKQSPNLSSVLSGAFFSSMPDLELVVKIFGDVKAERFFFPTHNGEVQHRRISFWISLFLETSIVALSFFACRYFKNRKRLT